MKQVINFSNKVYSLVENTRGNVRYEIEDFLNLISRLYSQSEIDSHSEDIEDLIMQYISLHN